MLRENPRLIMKQLLASLAASTAFTLGLTGVVAADPGKPCRVELDRSAAIRLAVSKANPGDVVLIAGKGHESTQTTGGQVVRFDDREVATAALEANP